MTDSLLQMGLSNACFSVALAIVAMVVGATSRRPHLAHMLWLLVFVKLVTPPIVTIPVVTIPEQAETAVAVNNHSHSGSPVSGVPVAGGREFGSSRPGPSLAGGQWFDVSRSGLRLAGGREFDVDEQPDTSLSARIGPVVVKHGKRWLPPIWLLGSVVVFAWSLVRVCRFGRLLAAESELAPQPLQAAAVKLARRLELKTIPTICTTLARLSPMVWWTGGRVRIVIPATLLDQMDAKQWQWILAHELAHVRRRDYLVRWIEWLCCVGFWWNPVVWWAGRNLRRAEEICCDALVLSCLNPEPQSYANSLLRAVEFLACPAFRPPAMASEINSGGFLERRFSMIVSRTPARATSGWLQACVLLCAVVVLPFGVACAQDYEAVGKRLRAAVAAGELTGEQAGAMLGTLRKISGAEKDQKADRARQYLMKLRKELGVAVEAGKISREDAVKRLKGAEKAIRERMAAGRGAKRVTREDYGHAEAELRKLVAEGKISGEAARARLGAMRRMIGGDEGDIEKGIGVWVKSVGERIKAAAEAGKLSEEEAWEKWGRFKNEEVAQKLKAVVKAGKMSEEKAWAIWHHIEKAEAVARLKAAVEKGELSEAEARAKWAEINREDDDEDEGREDDDDADDDEDEDGDEDEDDEDEDEEEHSGLEAVGRRLQAVGERLKAAVEADELSPEEAWAKWHGLKGRIIKGAVASGTISRKEAGRLWREVKKGEVRERLGQAVKAGKLSEEEARQKWEAFEREMEGRGDERRGDDDGIKPVPDAIARAIAGALLEAAPLDFPGVVAKAVGVVAGDDEKQLGMILVPAKGFIDEDEAPELEVGGSAPLALLFTSPSIVPVTGNQRVSRDRMHSVTVTDSEGKEHKSNCMVLIVKRIAEDDYRVYGMGDSNAPLIETRVTEGEGPGDAPFAMEIKEIDKESKTASVVITVFGKYQAAFRAGVAE